MLFLEAAIHLAGILVFSPRNRARNLFRHMMKSVRYLDIFITFFLFALLGIVSQYGGQGTINL